MLRLLVSILVVSACAPVVASAPSRSPGERTPWVHALAAETPKPHASRLRPPFGASAGVRRVASPPDNPTVVAAVERD